MTGWLLLFSVATSVNLYAQVDDQRDDIDRLLDEMFFDEQQFLDDIMASFYNYNFIYANVSFESNTYFSGRDSGVDQFNLVPQLSYYHSSGFNLSVSGIYYESYSPNWDFTSISAGYYHAVGHKKHFIYELGYTRYFYSDGWDTFNNSVYAGLGVRNKNRTLGTKLSASYLFGQDQAFQLISRTYARLTLTRQKGFVIKFRPQLNFVLAEQTLTWEMPGTQAVEAPEEVEYSDVFQLLNTQLNLPFGLSTKSWDFELGYSVNFPNPVDTEPSLDTTGFFTLSIGYFIDLGR